MMGNDNSLINFGELSKPATTLIEKVSYAIGGYFRPYQIKRVAKAEAEAKKITAKADLEITELERRAMQRFMSEESIKQDNMESITSKAIPDLDEDSDPNEVENDWIVNFFDKSRLISDDEMQDLWAKVLAGEANEPKTYSKRTVNFLSSMDKQDAILFKELCGFAWWIGNATPLIYDVDHEIYNNHQINYSSLKHLDNIGLLSFNSISGYARKNLRKKGMINYYETPIIIEFNDNNKENNLQIGKVLLSKTGQELAPICDSEPVDGFIDYVLEKWINQGIVTSSPLKN